MPTVIRPAGPGDGSFFSLSLSLISFTALTGICQNYVPEFKRNPRHFLTFAETSATALSRMLIAY